MDNLSGTNKHRNVKLEMMKALVFKITIQKFSIFMLGTPPFPPPPPHLGYGYGGPCQFIYFFELAPI